MNNLWEEVGNGCLAKALDLLKKETVPTAATVETVRALVETAISIDRLNLQWELQSRYGIDVSTQKLVSELQRREGVETTIAEPYQDVQVKASGPAIVLVVMD